MATMACPHCGGENVEGGSFCQTCGKALPAGGGGPRVVAGAVTAATEAGRAVQVEHLRKKARRAARILMLVGGVTLATVVLTFVLIAVGRAGAPRGLGVQMWLATGMGVGFIALGLWALIDPLPPSIIGLAVYGTLKVVQFVSVLPTLGQGSLEERAATAATLGMMIIPALLILFLAIAVGAGLQHRRLKEQLQQPGDGPRADR